MAGRTARSAEKEQYWREVIDGWRRSGGSVRQWCLERQVSEPSFYSWRRVSGGAGCFFCETEAGRQGNLPSHLPGGYAPRGDRAARATRRTQHPWRSLWSTEPTCWCVSIVSGTCCGMHWQRCDRSVGRRGHAELAAAGKNLLAEGAH